MANLAAVLETKQGSIVIRERPIPTPGPGELVIRNKAIAGNPVDWMVRDYGFGLTKFPTVLGSDVAGVVYSVGEGVKREVGDRLIGYAGVLYSDDADRGAWQTYTLVKERETITLPDSMSFEEGSTFPMALSTTLNAFFVQLDVKKGSILIWGAGGAMGGFMVQIARVLGLKVYATSSPKHFDRLRAYGAEVYDYGEPGTIERLKGVDYAVDCVTTEASTKALVQIGGKLAILGVWPGDEPEGVKHVLAYETFKDEKLIEWAFGEWMPKLLKGELVPGPIEIVDGGVSAASDVLDRIKQGVSGVKLVVRV